jgi:hypothetical protein
MNYTLFTADRGTHLRVICTGLGAAMLLFGLCMFARVPSSDADQAPGRTAAASIVSRSGILHSAANETTRLRPY